jgi:5-methylcytosine-specific restriction endonuclease McrA
MPATAGAALSTHRWQRLRQAILERDGYRCQMAGPRCKGVATTADHIKPRSEGGAMWDPANLRAACRPCNSGGGADLANETRRGRTMGDASRVW